jgi:hypothetical protein
MRSPSIHPSSASSAIPGFQNGFSSFIGVISSAPFGRDLVEVIWHWLLITVGDAEVWSDCTSLSPALDQPWSVNKIYTRLFLRSRAMFMLLVVFPLSLAW